MKMPSSTTANSRLLAAAFTGATLLAAGAPSRAAEGQMSFFKSRQATAAPKGPRALVQYVLRLTRLDIPDAVSPDPASPTTPVPALLASPILKTLDGETATISVASPDLAYMVALSPALPKTGNTVQTLWTFRLSGKDLPGGAKSVTLTGASEQNLGQSGIISEITLADPAAKRRSVFRLEGIPTSEVSAAAPVAPPAAPAPAPRPEPLATKRSN